MKKFVLILLLFVSMFLFVGCGETEKKDEGIKVTFDTLGGNPVETQDVTETGIATRPEDPTKIGYAFLGWTLDGADFNFESKITQSITLKAKWVEGVDLDFTGLGDADDFCITVPKGQEVDLPQPTREGYKFLCWIDENEDEYTTTGTFEESMFLEAKWHKIETYNLVFRDDETTLKSIQVTEGEKVEVFTPEKEGYTFEGWYTNTNYTKLFDFDNLNRSNAIYAKFVPIEYQVSFKTLSSTKTITVAYDSPYGTFPSISISNATFVGWQYEGKRVFESDIYKFTNDIELSPIIYVKSNFVVDGETTSAEYLVGSTGPYVRIDVYGKLFGGWFDNASYDGDGFYTIDTTKYANKTLYAYLVDANGHEDVKKAIVQNIADYYEEKLNNKVIYENMDLLSIDEFYGATISWSSNNPLVTSTGIINRTKQNLNVTLTATITYLGYSETASYDIILKEKIYRDISSNVISSYVYTANMGSGLSDTFFETVDVINLAFANCDTEGGLTLDASYLGIFNKYKEKAKEYGVRFIIVVGPASAPERFDAIAKSEALRKKFAKNIVDAINEYGFNGVDIDWEYPTGLTKGNYTLLMKEIYEQVKNNNPEDLVTSAIPAGPYTYPSYDLKNSNQYLDYINLMSYDMHSDYNASHHAALYHNSSVGVVSGCSIDESIATFTGKSCGVPKSKIVIGAAFYGRKAVTSTVATTNPLGKTLNGEKVVSITYTAIKNNYLTKSTCTEYWDDKAKANYCYDTATMTFISYDSAKSIKLKCEYLVNKGLAGIMWWDNGSDTTGELLQAVNDSLSIMKPE